MWLNKYYYIIMVVEFIYVCNQNNLKLAHLYIFMKICKYSFLRVFFVFILDWTMENKYILLISLVLILFLLYRLKLVIMCDSNALKFDKKCCKNFSNTVN